MAEVYGAGRRMSRGATGQLSIACGLIGCLLAGAAQAQDCGNLYDLAQGLYPRQFEGCRAGEPASGDPVCRWRFALKAPRAAQLEAALDARFSACMARQVDVGVNHPDTSRLTRYFAEGLQITLANKDKSALGATYVTLRFYRAPGG